MHEEPTTYAEESIYKQAAFRQASELTLSPGTVDGLELARTRDNSNWCYAILVGIKKTRARELTW